MLLVFLAALPEPPLNADCCARYSAFKMAFDLPQNTALFPGRDLRLREVTALPKVTQLLLSGEAISRARSWSFGDQDLCLSGCACCFPLEQDGQVLAAPVPATVSSSSFCSKASTEVGLGVSASVPGMSLPVRHP